MVTELFYGLAGFLATSGVAFVGYAIGRSVTDDEERAAADAAEDILATEIAEAYQRGQDDGRAHSDCLYADDWDAGYNAGLEFGRNSTSPDPAALTFAATAIRDARLPWMKTQVANYMSSYRQLLWRTLEVARDIGERYRKVESLGQGGLVPIGDALNVCVYVADIAKQYDDNRILTRPHAGVFEGKAS